MPQTTIDPAIVRLINVRLSFPHLFQPHAMEEGGEKKFSATFIMDNQQHGKLLDQLEILIDRMALDHFKKKVHLVPRYVCLHDGNEKPELDGYGDGTMFIVSSRKSRPATVDHNVIPVTEDDGVFYAGCYVNATIRLWVMDNKWGKGVNAELRAVQFVKDGESFGAAPVNAEDEFDAIDEQVEDKGREKQRTRGKPSTNLEDY